MSTLVASLTHPIALMQPERLRQSGWIEHIPFAFYLMQTARPRVLVELGTHHGVSYCAFCQAAQYTQLDTSFYAVDTWKGDEHAGFYGNEVFTDLKVYHDSRYANFSQLLRMSFDDALAYFADGSIDILHLDGYHAYDDTKHHYEAWLPKLSEHGIILFHDINVHERQFGVWKLWEELKTQYPAFAFGHGHGLGLLAVGTQFPGDTQLLFESNADEQLRVRSFFAFAGRRWRTVYDQQQEMLTLREQMAKDKQTQKEREKQLTQAQQTQHEHEHQLTEQLTQAQTAQYEHEQRLAEQESQIQQLEQVITARDEHIAQQTQTLADRQQLEHELRQLLAQHEQTLARQQGQLEQLQQVIAARDASFAQQVQTLADQQHLEADLRELLAQREQTLAGTILQNQHLEQMLSAQAQTLAADAIQQQQLEAELQQSQQQVAAMTTELNEYQQQLQRIERQLKQAEQKYQEQIKKLLENNEQLNRHNQSLRHNHSEYRELQSQIARLNLLVARGAASQTSRVLRGLLHIRQQWQQKLLTIRLRMGQLQPPVLFDSQWYLEQYPDVATSAQQPYLHYLVQGWLEGKNPSPLFDTNSYLARYEDVMLAGINPLVHYLVHGWREGRNPHPLFDTHWYLQQNPDVARERVEPLLHYLERGWREGRNPHPLFDTAWYLQQNPDVAANGMNPLVHYVRFGAGKQRDPNPLFDTAWYVAQNPELAHNHQNPLQHYIEVGANQFYRPHPVFDPTYYAELESGQKNPLIDFVARYGMNSATLYDLFVKKRGLLKEIKHYAIKDTETVQKNIAAYIQNRKANNRIAVYTAIVNNYDILKIPEHPAPEIDYYCFSNTPQPTYGIYTILPIDYFGDDATRTARFIKTHPHLYFSDYDLVLWIDANIVVQTNIMSFIQKFLASNLLIASVRHPLRKSIQEEAQECIALAKDAHPVIQQQMAQYQAEGYQQTMPLIETNLLMIKLQDKRSQQFLESWWMEIEKHSKRDQLSVNYALDKHQLQVYHLFPVGFSARDFPGFALVTHTKKVGEPNYNTSGIGSYAAVVDPYQGRTYHAEKQQRLQVYNKLPVDIIICVHNALADVRLCLEAVNSTRSKQHRIILIDDGSDNETHDYLLRLSQEYDNILLECNETPRRYTRAVNQGLKLSTAGFVILLNSDTIVSQDWIEKLADAVFSTPYTAIVGPLSNAASHQSIPNHHSSENQTAINALPDGMTVDDMNRCCEQWTHAEILPRVPLVHGFCMGLRREVIDVIGYMDEEHFPQGFGEENDYCLRAVAAGFSLVIATHTYVYHAKTKSYALDERNQIAKASSKVLQSLHGRERVQRAIHAMNTHPMLCEIRKKAAVLYSK
jgi:GT2 family glycosyltransferase